MTKTHQLSPTDSWVLVKVPFLALEMVFSDFSFQHHLSLSWGIGAWGIPWVHPLEGLLELQALLLGAFLSERWAFACWVRPPHGEAAIRI